MHIRLISPKEAEDFYTLALSVKLTKWVHVPGNTIKNYFDCKNGLQ